jgi:sterol desaturase/sphingolipid hydroxylase (fatty acid hydroxylase superfamily)
MFLHFIFGLLLANLMEWAIHKYFLHNLGKKKASLFWFHWGAHHREARKNNFIDSKVSPREIVGVFLLCLLTSPIIFISPIFYTGMFMYAMVYLLVHNYAHRNPDWCYKYMRWHYDHHMGKDQDKNWCIVVPFSDFLLGTRRKYDYKDR